MSMDPDTMTPEAAMRRMSLQETAEDGSINTKEHQPDDMQAEAAEHLFEGTDTNKDHPDTAEDEADAEGYEPDDDGED